MKSFTETCLSPPVGDWDTHEMENLETSVHAIQPNKLEPNLAHLTLSTFPFPSIYTIHHTPTESIFSKHPFDLSDVPNSHPLSISAPVALTLHNEAPVLACRDGELISLNDGVDHIGDFTEDDPEKSGILAAASSSDGCLLLVVTPVSVSILDPEFEVCAELPCEGAATLANVAWRSDGDYFVVLRRVGERTLGFVSDRAGKLVNKLELEDVPSNCCVTWEPRPGGMIAVVHGSMLMFFERNGLRHRRSDFDVGRDITLLRWSPDGRVLLIFGEGVLDIWLKRNYAWYCKKRLVIDGFVDALWDEDDPHLLRVFQANGSVQHLRFTVVPSTCLAVENGPLLAVTHGHSVILTNLGAGLVPPPMNHGHVTFDVGVESVCCSRDSNILGCLLADGSFETAVLSEPHGKPTFSNDLLAENSIRASRSRWRLLKLGESQNLFRFPVFITDSVIAVVKQKELWTDRTMPSDEVHVFRIQQGESVAKVIAQYSSDGQITSMCATSGDSKGLIVTTSSGRLIHLSVDTDSGYLVELCRTSCTTAESACTVVYVTRKGTSDANFVQNEHGRLEVVDADMETSSIVSEECTSFAVLGDYLVFTTRSNLFCCQSLRQGNSSREENGNLHTTPISHSIETNGSTIAAPTNRTIRPVDRGSVIVASLQDEVSVVLQAPRGNLETIVPRPLVLNKVKKLVERENFGRAFTLCRRQRVDMNHIVDADFSLFMKNVDKFVSQISIPEHLSIFMTLLKGEAKKVNDVCEAVVVALQTSSQADRFTSAVLTGMMRQEPRDFEGALSEVKRAFSSSSELGRSAVDYLFVLVKNQELVYEHSLGTYDLDLAGLVAESSQMDPASYHPELVSLMKKGERERRIAIDLKLQRYSKALVHLHGGGRERFQECVSLCLEHSLYETAIPLFKDEKNIMETLLDGYGKHLKKEERFDEAAAIFRQIDDSRSACECYRLSGRWQLAANSAATSALPEDEKVALWNAIATDLEENGRVLESAQVRANFLNEASTAVSLLLEGEEWEAAFEIAARDMPTSEGEDQDRFTEITREVVQSAVSFKGNIDENCTKLEDRRQRLTTLRNTKEIMRQHLARRQQEHEADSDMFSETTASSLSNLSDVTFYSKASATSLYSTATQTGPLSSAKLEKKALRRKQRESKKRIREGHPREEEAIVVYMRKLLPTTFSQRRTESFVRALLFVQKPEMATALTNAFRKYVSQALTLPDDVLGEEKARLEIADKEWTSGLPIAMALVHGKVGDVQENA